MALENRMAQVLEVRDSDSGPPEADIRIVSYNRLDTFNTTFKPGAFARSIAEGSLPAVWCHDATRPIGIITNFRDTNEALEGTLTFLDFNSVPDARMAYESVKKGVIKGISIGFARAKEEADPNTRGASRITDAELVEASCVLRASVPGARVLAVRSTEDNTSNRFTIMKRSPHAAVIEDDTCEHCGEQLDFRAHTTSREVIELRDLTATLAAEPILEPAEPNSLIATADLALDAAIALASSQDLTELPGWVPQLLSLVMAADANVDAASAALNLPVPEESIADDMARAFTTLETRSDEPDLDLEAMLNRLSSIGVRADKQPYGKVEYADPKNGKYPLNTEARVRAAIAYISMPKNAAKYPMNGVSLESVKAKIRAAAKKFGIEVNKDF